MFCLCSALICCFISIISAQGASTGVVRLYRNGVADTSQSWSSGIVQIYYSGQWGNICDNGRFGSDEADVICHQLGYTGASSYSNTGTTTTWGSDNSPTVMDDVSCSTDYITVTQCSFSTNISSSCIDTTDVTVTCFSTSLTFIPFTGDIRLTGGEYSNQGLLEVYCNSQWGTVCDDFFGDTEARVACRQLGYNDYEDYDHLSQEGTSSQAIFLRSFSGCASSDNCLTQCGGCPSSGISSCSHDEDVTLECSYSSENGDVYTTIFTSCIYYDYSTGCVNVLSTDTGVIIAAVVGSIIGIIVCIIIIIAIPIICICVCFGIGIKAANRSSARSGVVTHQPPSTVVTQDATKPLMDQPQESAYYPADPDKPAGYQPPPPPATAGYEPPPGYTPYQPTPANIPQQGPPGQEQIGYTGYPEQ